jgi:oleate hydratase
MLQNRKAFMVGSGIGSLAAAAFMIRDGGIPGKNTRSPLDQPT